MRFRATVRTAEGKREHVTVEARSEMEAAKLLRGDGHTPVRIVLVRNGSSLRGGSTYRSSDVLEFTETIGTMVSAGLSLQEALEVSEAVFERRRTRDLVSLIRNRVGNGESFADVIGSMERTFPPVYRGMVAIGDRLGSLSRVLDRLLSYLRSQKTMRDQMVGALIYPTLVLALAIVAMTVVATVVLPRMSVAFSAFAGDALLDLERVIRRFRFLINGGVAAVIGIVAVTASVLVAARFSPRLAVSAELLLLRIPVLGELVRSQRCLNFLFAVEMMTEADVPIDDAFRHAADAAGGAAFPAAIARVSEIVRRGGLLSEAMVRERVFPERISRWIIVGERTGDVASVFSQLRHFYQAEHKKRGDRIMTLAEPIMMIVVGAGIVALVLLFVLPVLSAFGNIL